ncbi:MAG: MBL fold metallo-hydrolase [Verrucomicrobia bacterium]|nr:MBL fold metallo-hydrolase [Verrucomicrobiota bacterium]
MIRQDLQSTQALSATVAEGAFHRQASVLAKRLAGAGGPKPARWPAGVLACAAASLLAQDAPQFTRVQSLTNREVALQLAATKNQHYRVETSVDLVRWTSLLTLLSTGSDRHTDSAAPYLDSRFYRALEVSGPDILTGDHLATDDGEVIIHPLNHASFIMRWQGKTIYNDPVSAAGPFTSLPKADLILVSHSHGDHFDGATLNAIRGLNAVIIAPQAVFTSLSATLKALTIVMTNGATTSVLGLTTDAVPAYNSNHPKGTGNGYVLTIGGKRIYMSGDTGNIAEMRALQNIDLAFVCMNVPYTMAVTDAATAVRAFRPKVVYPYHFRNQDGSLANLATFKRLVGTDLFVEVRTRKWY